MKTNLKFNTVKEQDDYIQSLSLKELNTKIEFLLQNFENIIPEPEIENNNNIKTHLK